MAKWDLSKLPEGRKPLPDEWFREKAQMQERIEELEGERDEALSQLDSARHSISVLEKRAKTFCDGWGIADKGRIEAEAKLAKAVGFIEDLTGCEWPYNEDAKRILAELKGEE